MENICLGCGKRRSQFKCSGCMIGTYCDKKCMKKDWLRHCHECPSGSVARCTIPKRYIQPKMADSMFLIQDHRNENFVNHDWKHMVVIVPQQRSNVGDDNNNNQCGTFYDTMERTCTRGKGEKIYDPNIDETSYEVIDFLGKGAFGSVNLVKDKMYGGGERKIAVKDIIVDTLKVNPSILRELEITHMFGGTVAGACKVGSFVSKDPTHKRHFIMYLERASDDLRKFIRKTWSEINALDSSNKSSAFDLLRDDILLTAYQMITSVIACHSKFLCNGDIKTPNFLVYGSTTDSSHPSPGSRFTRVEMTDFGLSCSFCDVPRHVTATIVPVYSPPESFTNVNYALGLSGDVWSLGIALYELVTGKLYFDKAKEFGDFLAIAYEIEMLNHPHDEQTTGNITSSYLSSLSLFPKISKNLSDMAKDYAKTMFSSSSPSSSAAAAEQQQQQPHVFQEVVDVILMLLRYRKMDRPNIFEIYDKATKLRTAKLSSAKGGMSVEEFMQQAIPNVINDRSKWPTFIKGTENSGTPVAYDGKSVIRIYREMELPIPAITSPAKLGEKIPFFWWYREGVLSFFRDSWITMTPTEFGVDETPFVALDIFRRYAYSVVKKGESRRNPQSEDYAKWRDEFRSVYSIAHKYWVKDMINSRLEQIGKVISTTATTHIVEDPSDMNLEVINEWETLSSIDYDVSRPTFIQFMRWYSIINEPFVMSDEKRIISTLLYLVLVSSHRQSSGMTQSEMCLQAMCACGKIYGIEIVDEHSSIVKLTENSLEVFSDEDGLKFVTKTIGLLDDDDRNIMEKINKLIQITSDEIEKLMS